MTASDHARARERVRVQVLMRDEIVVTGLSAHDVAAAVEAAFPDASVTVTGDQHPDRSCAGRDVGQYALTQRELQILELITQGLSNREIAQELFISVNSVKSFIRAAYRKIGVTSRSHAVAWGVRRGLGHDADDRG